MEVEVGVAGEETEEREAGAMVLQLTEAKWLLRLSATEVGSEPVENELFVCKAYEDFTPEEKARVVGKGKQSKV